MCRPANRSREEACPGGHTGPPLRGGGNVPEITEIGTENEHSPSGEQSRTIYGGVRLGCGFRQPNSETEFVAAGCGHPALRKQRWWFLAVGRCGHRPLRPAGGRGTARRVVVPYGWLRRAAAIALGSGAQRSVCGADGRKWVGIAAEIIHKGASNAGQSLSHGYTVPAPFTQGSLWGRGMRIAASLRSSQ